MSETSYEIEIVAVPEQHLACLRARVPLDGLDDLGRRLLRIFADAGVDPAGALQWRIYDDSDPRGADVEVCLPVAPDATGWVPDAVGEATVAITPAHHAMATTHAGSRATIAGAHEAIRRELEKLGYVQAGPATETSVEVEHASSAGDRSPSEADDAVVTVVCYPYAR